MEQEFKGQETASGDVRKAVLEEARRLIEKHAPHAGVHPTIVPGLTLYRIESNAFIERSAGELMASFIVSGRKSTAIGGRVLQYGPGESLVCGIASPSEFHALDAAPDHPFLALSVSLELPILMEYASALSQSCGIRRAGSDLPSGIFVIRPDGDLALGFLALLRLLERPSLARIRAPLCLRDLHVLLLDSSCGAALRSLASAGSEGYAVMSVVAWIRKHYSEPASIESLAERANMSNSTFHRRFRQVTGSSPLQFRKRVRLFEARRMLLSRQTNVSTAAYEVGYESPAQFVRDYKALFGAPPLRDVKRLVDG